MLDNLLSVSLADYEGKGNRSFGGNGSNEDLQALEKALYAREITGRDTDGLTTASGAPLKVESLEQTLKILTFKESDIVLWKKIPKLPAYNTVEEYNQVMDYGSEDYSFNNEGELPEEDDSTFVRRAQLVKFMGTTRVISHPMQLVSTTIGDVVQNQIKHGTMKILRDVNKALTTANSDHIPQQFNGIYKQHLDAFTSLDNWYNDETTIDLRGQALTESSIEDAALTIIENFGEPSLLMAPPKVLSNFVKRFHGEKFIQPNTAALTDGIMGQRVKQFMSQYGEIDLGYDKFMASEPKKTLASNATNLKAPAKPVADATTPKAAVADATNLFNVDGAGDYFYAVSAINRYGESALTNLATAAAPNAEITVASTESVDLTFTSGGGAVPATCYRVYRSKKDSASSTAATADFYPIFKVSVQELATGYDGAVATKVRDKNRYLPDTDSSFMIEPTIDVFSFKQLAPLMKMDLAQLGPAMRFMVLLYGTPILYAPRKFVRFINVGKSLS